MHTVPDTSFRPASEVTSQETGLAIFKSHCDGLMSKQKTVLDKTAMASSSHTRAVFLLNNACVWQTASHAHTCASDGTV